MVEDKKNTTKKKTLSLKLGSSVKSNPIKSFESGSTVIVERKRLRKNVIASAEKIEPEKKQSPKLDEPEKKVETEVKEVKKSGKILKRLSKEEQKKLQEAKNAADKEDVLKEIGGIVNEQPQESKEEQLKATEESQEETIRVVEEKDNKPVTTFKETELNEDQKDKKKPSGGYGRKNLRERNFWVYGFDARGEKDFTEIKWEGKNVLLFGSEGFGMREHTGKYADFFVKIDMNKDIESLNISNSAAIVFHHLSYLKKKS